MGKSTAINLVMIGGLLVIGVSIVGLRALGADESVVALGFIVPLIGGSYLISRIVLHYGANEQRRR